MQSEWQRMKESLGPAAGQMCLMPATCVLREIRKTLEDMCSLGPPLLIKNFKGLFFYLKILRENQIDGEIWVLWWLDILALLRWFWNCCAQKPCYGAQMRKCGIGSAMKLPRGMGGSDGSRRTCRKLCERTLVLQSPQSPCHLFRRITSWKRKLVCVLHIMVLLFTTTSVPWVLKWTWANPPSSWSEVQCQKHRKLKCFGQVCTAC